LVDFLLAQAHLVGSADKHQQPVVVALAGWRVLVDDEHLGAGAQLQRLEVAAALSEDATNDPPLDEHVVPDVVQRLLCPVDGLTHVAHQVAAARPVV